MSSFPPDWTPMTDVLVDLQKSKEVRDLADLTQIALQRLGEAISAHPECHGIVAEQEARDSSAIEGLFADGAVDACRTALAAGHAGLDKLPISGRLAESVCSKVLGEPTTVRRVKCWIQASDGTIVYEPPCGHERLQALLADWAAGMNAEGFDPLVQAAAGHAQFEAIHPFHDGNGRSGRALVILHLVARGCLSAPLLCLSDRLRAEQQEYYRGLSDYRSINAWRPWTCFMLRAIARGADVAQFLLGEFH